MAVDKNGKKLPPGVRQRANGRYEGRIKHEYRSYSVYADTLTDVKKQMREMKYKLEHGLYVEKRKITLEEWCNTWLEEYKKNHVKAGTYINYKAYYESIIRKRMGDKRISDIRGEHIQKLYNDMVKEEYSHSSIKLVKVVLDGCFKQALKNGLIERNPVELAELPKNKTNNTRQALTKEQQALFMEFAKESYLYNFFVVMLRTGMRNGEMRGLKYTDIDKKKKILHVQRTLKYINNQGFIEDTPKTKTSTRDIPLTASTLQIIEAQKNYWGFKIERFDRYLFCNEEGGPLGPAKVQSEINRITKRIVAAGHDFPYITAHVFRHTFATRAIEAGMKPQVLKTILGHSSLAMTMDLYSHVLPDTKAEEMEKIANVF